MKKISPIPSLNTEKVKRATVHIWEEFCSSTTLPQTVTDTILCNAPNIMGSSEHAVSNTVWGREDTFYTFLYWMQKQSTA